MTGVWKTRKDSEDLKGRTIPVSAETDESAEELSG